MHARVHAVCDAGRMMQGLLAVHHLLFPKSKKTKLMNVSSQRCEHTPLMLTKKEGLAGGLKS